ncbi:MAG: RluA family pseudouridine synthase [Pirellulales bacterium]
MTYILYVDDRLLVLDKPSGLLAVPGRGPDKQDCLASRALIQFPSARVVHRLDRDTSGVFVMALDAETQRILGRQFEERRIAKTYLAVVAGIVSQESGRIDLPLRKDFDHPPRHMVDHLQGKPSETEWRVLHRGADRTWLELRPRTGRSHQLRIHLQQIGHPILGDPLYATAEIQALAPRLLLHAASLCLVHPSTDAALTVTSPCGFWPIVET